MKAALLVALCAAILISCKRGDDPPVLPLEEWHTALLPADGGALPIPRSLAIGTNDDLAVLDTAGRVLIYNASGALQRHWKMLDVSVGKPEGLVLLRDGRVVVCDTHYHRLVWFDREGHVLKTVGRRGAGRSEFIYPVGICNDPAENLYVCEYGGNDRVQKFTRDGEWLAAFGSFGTGPEQFQRPSGLTWHEGKLYVADAINNRILIFTDGGLFVSLLGAGEKPLLFQLPYDIKTGRDGALYIIEYGAGRLSRVSPTGKLLGRFGKNGSGEGEFGTPWGLAIDQQMRIHVADTKNRRLVTLRFHASHPN